MQWIPDALLEQAFKVAAAHHGIKADKKTIKEAIAKWRKSKSSMDPATINRIFDEMLPKLREQNPDWKQNDRLRGTDDVPPPVVRTDDILWRKRESWKDAFEFLMSRDYYGKDRQEAHENMAKDISEWEMAMKPMTPEARFNMHRDIQSTIRDRAKRLNIVIDDIGAPSQAIDLARWLEPGNPVRITVKEARSIVGLSLDKEWNHLSDDTVLVIQL